MDPIEAQIQQGLQQLASQPGFGGYTPSPSTVDQPAAVNQGLSLSPMGIQSDFDITGVGTPGPGTVGMPDIVEMGRNIAINKAIDFGVQKLGLPSIIGPAISTVVNPMSMTAFGLNPLSGIAALNTGLQSSLFGRSATIADYLEAKRAQKAIQRESVKDLQERMDRGEFGSTTPTPQDKARTGQYDRKGGDGPGGKGSGATGRDAGMGMGGKTR